MSAADAIQRACSEQTVRDRARIAHRDVDVVARQYDLICDLEDLVTDLRSRLSPGHRHCVPLATHLHALNDAHTARALLAEANRTP